MAFAKFDLLKWMPPDLRTEFLNRLQRRQYRPGQSIYVQGSPDVEMFRLASGTVRISVLRPDGRQITYTLFEPGDCFGQTSLIDEGVRPQTTEASSSVEVCFLGTLFFWSLAVSFHRSIRPICACWQRNFAYWLKTMKAPASTISTYELRVRSCRRPQWRRRASLVHPNCWWLDSLRRSLPPW